MIELSLHRSQYMELIWILEMEKSPLGEDGILTLLRFSILFICILALHMCATVTSFMYNLLSVKNLSASKE